jgi:hypothetical protein
MFILPRLPMMTLRRISAGRILKVEIRGDAALITVELRDGGRHVSGSISPVDLVEDSGLFSGLVIRLLNEIGGLPT